MSELFDKVMSEVHSSGTDDSIEMRGVFEEWSPSIIVGVAAALLSTPYARDAIMSIFSNHQTKLYVFIVFAIVSMSCKYIPKMITLSINK